MLYAYKRELHAELAKDILMIRQRELDYYTANINNIGLNASLLSGFAFTTLTSHESREAMEWLDDKSDGPFVLIDIQQLGPDQQMQVLLELFYLTSTISAMGSTLYTLYICLISSVLGPGLALRGPEGSVDRAVIGLARVNRKVIQSFAFALNLFQFSILVNSFLNFHVIAAVVCMFFVVRYMFTITRNGNHLIREFVIDPSAIVTGQFEQEVIEQDDEYAQQRRDAQSASESLFPSVSKGIRDDIKRKKNKKHRALTADEYPHALKPSTVAGNMLHRWQGPLLSGEDNMPPDDDGSGGGLDAWFANIFGAETAKPNPRPGDAPPKPLVTVIPRPESSDGSGSMDGDEWSVSTGSDNDGGRSLRQSRR